MKTWTKILIGIGTAVVLLAILGFTIVQSRRNVVTVQTGAVHRQDLVSIVTASGEIKPREYVNIGANAFGKITRLYVKEGDKVGKGAPLAQIENVQPAADVAATRAELQAAQTDTRAAEAALRTNQADLNRAKADAERARLDYQRAQALLEEALIAKAEYDTRKAAWEVADAAVAQAKARVLQSEAQLQSASQRIAQIRAKLTGATDVLSKTSYNAPFAGTVTNLPVREGETVVVGIQNSPGSTLMTLADMSTITAEVRVDETDVVNVRIGQPAEVTIDAIPRKTFKGVVTDIGDNAMVRSTGVATSQTTAGSQEAKDFKVVVTLQEPPPNLRPGLSCTAKIETAKRANVLSMPIQALTVRQRKDLKENNTRSSDPPVPITDSDRQELQGVFVVRNKKAEFVQVETGIAGTTEIEVLKGLQEGDQIVTGSYKVLRTLRNGSSVKIDNSAPKKEDEST
ncbi:MAG: efflux RND transporter periplasmic adaptor subunit [Terriglobales bacterium]